MRSMYRSAFARDPAPDESADALRFLRSQAAEFGVMGEGWRDDPRAWADLAHVLFNAKEFVFLD